MSYFEHSLEVFYFNAILNIFCVLLSGGPLWGNDVIIVFGSTYSILLLFLEWKVFLIFYYVMFSFWLYQCTAFTVQSLAGEELHYAHTNNYMLKFRQSPLKRGFGLGLLLNMVVLLFASTQLQFFPSNILGAVASCFLSYMYLQIFCGFTHLKFICVYWSCWVCCVPGI